MVYFKFNFTVRVKMHMIHVLLMHMLIICRDHYAGTIIIFFHSEQLAREGTDYAFEDDNDVIDKIEDDLDSQGMVKCIYIHVCKTANVLEMSSRRAKWGEICDSGGILGSICATSGTLTLANGQISCLNMAILKIGPYL